MITYMCGVEVGYIVGVNFITRMAGNTLLAWGLILLYECSCVSTNCVYNGLANYRHYFHTTGSAVPSCVSCRRLIPSIVELVKCMKCSLVYHRTCTGLDKHYGIFAIPYCAECRDDKETEL